MRAIRASARCTQLHLACASRLQGKQGEGESEGRKGYSVAYLASTASHTGFTGTRHKPERIGVGARATLSDCYVARMALFDVSGAYVRR